MKKHLEKIWNEFYEILYMPEIYIVYRHLFRYNLGYTKIWEEEYRSLAASDREMAHKIIEKNVFADEEINKYKPNIKVRNFLRHYTIKRGSIERNDTEYKKLKSKFDKLIKEDQFIDLTLTYDFESPAARKIHKSVANNPLRIFVDNK
ncbi:MAG: hypothetical protein IPK21_00065 [Haliscomenobacter sp.]|nr:hypothetical protein [Haliscomenobacter sp.]